VITMSPCNMRGIDSNKPLREYCTMLRSKYRSNNGVLLVQIPQFVMKSFNRDVALKRGYHAFPPAGLQYLYEAIKQRSLDVCILDLNLLLLERVCEDELFNHEDWLTIFEDYMRIYTPFIVGVSCLYDTGIPLLKQILEFLVKLDKSVVVTGGVIASYEWKNLLARDLCHFVIRGEGENKINYLFDYLTDENLGYKPNAGIYFKYLDVCHETTGDTDPVKLRGSLIDSYSLVKIKEYCRYGSLNPFSRIANIRSSPFAAIQLSRGCRGSCSFCSVRDFMGKGVRKRPVEDVLREMEFLIHNCGVRHFEWLDDDLLFFKKDFQDILESIIKHKWTITWSANNGLIASSIDNYTMQLMRDSGCIGFKIGIETGNADILKKIKKPAKLDTFRKVSKLFDKYPEVFVGGNFMIGFPEERFYQMMDSFRFYLELNLDWGAFTICQMIRGATAFSEFEDYFNAQMDTDAENIKNFIPSRESSNGRISTKNGFAGGLEVFKLDPELIPDEDQIKEIWFVFNLVGNYINNKNLKPGGRVDKFISWVEMAQAGYPANPYMSLFLSLAYTIKGDYVKTNEYYNKAVEYYKTDYWQERFKSFGLLEILNNFPKNKDESFMAIQSLREMVDEYY